MDVWKNAGAVLVCSPWFLSAANDYWGHVLFVLNEVKRCMNGEYTVLDLHVEYTYLRYTI